MALRFHRTLRLIPGLRLNLSKSGVSASVGTRGAWLTFGKRRTRATVGIPGTGISYTETLPPHQHTEPPNVAQEATRPRASTWIVLLILLAVALVVGWLIGVGMR